MKKEIKTSKHLSGFQEWLPAEQLAFEQFKKTTAEVFSLYGYVPLETTAFEKQETLASKGDIKNEIYGVYRLQDVNDEDNRFALRFDHTVPLARYVAGNFSELSFPFKRFALGKVWRGERAKQGRYREFYQADIDVLGVDALSLQFDAEVLEMSHATLTALGVKDFVLRVSNRKFIQGYYESLGVAKNKIFDVMAVIDKLKKMSRSDILENIQKQGELDIITAEKILDFSAQTFPKSELFARLREMQGNEMLEAGKLELSETISALEHIPDDQILVDFSIVRGLDYYTGMVFETTVNNADEFGSICSGGRYEDLASRFIKKQIPGVGASIGLSRLFALLLQQGNISAEQSSPSQALLVLFDETQRVQARQLARNLRKAGIACEVSHRSGQISKQVEYASKKGIPQAIFIEEKGYSIKNLLNGEQKTYIDEENCIASFRS